jgi:hypothetical protein
MRVSRQKLEEFARRHGFDSFQNMKDDAVRKKLEQKDQPDSELAQAAQDALTQDPSDSELGFLEAKGAEQEILQQIEGLLERFPELSSADSLRRDGLKAVARMKGGPETLELWRRVRPAGLALSDAYLLVNLDDILAQQREAAWQSAVSSLAGRAHLLPSAGNVLEDSPVPGNVFELYRALNPNASETEIRSHYHRSKSKSKSK